MLSRSQSQEWNILVSCKDERGIKWVKLLLSRFEQVYLITSASDCRLFAQDDLEGTILPIRLLPANYDAIFFHSNDENLVNERSITTKLKFEFNTPGQPFQREGVLPILRCTAPYFDIGLRDVDEIFDYLTERKTNLPSICLPLINLELTPSLLLLSQYYLNSNSPTRLQGSLWWLRSLGLLKNNRVDLDALKDLKASFEIEWKNINNPCIEKDTVQLLLDKIFDTEIDVESFCKSEIPSQVISDACNILEKKIGLEKSVFFPEIYNAEHIKSNVSIVYTFSKSFASAAISTIITDTLNIKHQFIEISESQNIQPTKHKSILVITEREIIELPRIRLKDFSGAVLVISTKPFSVLKKKYRILRFGQGSHETFEFPWNLSSLFTKVSNLLPLEPENLDFLKNELGFYKDIYSNQVLYYMQQLQQSDDFIMTVDLIEKIENIIEQLRVSLPVAFHAIALIDNQRLQIQQHFRTSIENIRNSKSLDQKSVNYLIKTFKELENLVLCTGAN